MWHGREWSPISGDEFYGINNDPWLPNVVFRGMRRVTPNLRQFRLWQDRLSGDIEDDGRGAEKTALFESATLSLIKQRSPCLEELHVAGISHYFTAADVLEYKADGTLDVLKKLFIDCTIETEALWALSQCSFKCLTALTLELQIESYRFARYMKRPDETSVPARLFLCSIRPLTSLKLTGEMDFVCVRDAVAHHGRGLQTLWIVPAGLSQARLSLPPEEVSWIAGHCQLLKELRLHMSRSRGDSTEVAAYSALGRIPPLQFLDLTLDAADFRLENPQLANDEDDEDHRACEDDDQLPLARPQSYFTDFDDKSAKLRIGTFGHEILRKGHIKDMLINCAISETLARAIVQKLTAGKSFRRFPFQQIYLRAEGGGEFGSNPVKEIEIVAEELQQSWLFEPDGDRTTNHEFDMICLKKVKKYPRNCENLDKRVEEIFRRIWPAPSEGNGDWRTEWEGIPLAGSGERLE